VGFGKLLSPEAKRTVIFYAHYAASQSIRPPGRMETL